jgi:glycine/D-amino acid oxidase-like deaminating enzyme
MIETAKIAIVGAGHVGVTLAYACAVIDKLGL